MIRVNAILQVVFSDLRPRIKSKYISHGLSQNWPSPAWRQHPLWIRETASVPLCLSSYFMGGKHQEAITQNKPDWLRDNYSTVLDVRQRSHPGPRQMTCELPVAELNFNCVISFSSSSMNTHSAIWGSSQQCSLSRWSAIAGRCCIVENQRAVTQPLCLLFSIPVSHLVYKAGPGTCAC